MPEPFNGKSDDHGLLGIVLIIYRAMLAILVQVPWCTTISCQAALQILVTMNLVVSEQVELPQENPPVLDAFQFE